MSLLEDPDDEEQKLPPKHLEPKKKDLLQGNVQLLTFRETNLSADYTMIRNSVSPKSVFNKEKENQKLKAWISD